MAIQFSCPSCSQPIEIDDEFGGRQVACPYCRGVITAPTESTLHIGQIASTEAPPPPPTPPMAQVPGSPVSGSPASGDGAYPWQTPQQPSWTAGGAYPPIPPHEPVAARRRNLPGILGVVFAVLAFVCMAKMVSIAMAHKDDLGIGGNAKVDQMEMQRRLNEMMLHPEKNPWVTKMIGCLMGLMLFWVVSLICSIVGMARRYKSRAPAIMGLILALLPFLLMCGGVIVR